MLTNILWGLFIVGFIVLMIYLDKRNQKKNFHTPYRDKTEQQKEVERAIEIEKSRRGGPPDGGGFGGM
ncbi:hypothetical protein NC661_04005 [Aquibacillus koreensis]|uniref:Uncharacterized protein n=1 Tax=Aquibacillus koreensis TaxID=279446 RepID=A0A9X3WGW8_9BACI|nr:hypothetical protein [Aquibacillus koreensis]MCT2534864.1 hypothetical protein [Aquibacillus koreensis]MDC3419525.1 hypothetical protein [Aquibacillus koreensis]